MYIEKYVCVCALFGFAIPTCCVPCPIPTEFIFH